MTLSFVVFMPCYNYLLYYSSGNSVESMYVNLSSSINTIFLNFVFKLNIYTYQHDDNFTYLKTETASRTLPNF